MQVINTSCTQCNKEFPVTSGEYNRKIKLGKTTFFCSLSCGTKHQLNIRSIKTQEAYAASPVLCLTCKSPLPYKLRHQNKYCNHSCAARHTNTFPTRKKKKLVPCEACGKPVAYKFCDSVCLNKLRRQQRIAKFLAGEALGEASAKRYFLEQQQGKCAICGISTWRDKPVLLILDHINGHSDNNTVDNLRLVCSNCDATLPTYKGRNKGQGRFTRKMRYRTGKSH